MRRASLRDLFAVAHLLEEAGFKVVLSRPDSQYRARVFYEVPGSYREIAFSGGLGPTLDFLSAIWFGYEKAQQYDEEKSYRK